MKFANVFENKYKTATHYFGPIYFLCKLLFDRFVKQTFYVKQTFSHVMFLVMMVTNCRAERSFSKIKIIKKSFAHTMTQFRLSTLSLMRSESDDIVDEFTNQKARKVQESDLMTKQVPNTCTESFLLM